MSEGRTVAQNSKNSDETDSTNKPSIAHRLHMPRKAVRIVAASLAALVVFSAGIAVGNGTITFNQYDSQNSGLPNSLTYSSVDQVYRTLKANYDGKLTEQQLLEGMKAGLAESTKDPYTEFFSPKEAQKFDEQLSGSFSGIGAELGQDEDKNLIVVAPIDGFPADKAGLRAKDAIVAINGTSTSGMSVDDAVSKIRGKKGTQVTLRIIRNKSEQLNLTITRDTIKIPSVKHEILDGNIGYIRITQFSDDTGTLATQAAQEFEEKGVNGVILDMRDNPGGLLDQAVAVSELWLPTGTKILDEKRGDQVIQSYPAAGSSILKGMPTVVLINGGSASASEITAGALKDNNAATLLGEKSYGKGSVQTIQDFKDGSQLKVTVARWYRPNGQNIDKKGIQPDKTVTMTDDDYKTNKDPQKDAAIQMLQAQ